MGVSCAEDWNDHYDASVADNGTLWEAIATDQNLSNFARVVQACGYDKVLDGSQTFSVFAPVNSSLTALEADSLISAFARQMTDGTRSDDNTVVRQFIQNHIALFKHPVSSLTNDSITMMNDKYAVLTGTTLAGSRLLSSNSLHNNGLLFTVDRKIDYFHNVLEYLGHDLDLDSVYQFLNSYSVYEFNDAKSVPGEIVDGMTIYLDSVSDLRNTLLDTYGLINSEDSTYWMLCPTNNEWNRLVEAYQPYFNYANNVARRDSLAFVNLRMAILSGTCFSRTINTDETFADSAVSTQAYTYLQRQLLGIDEAYNIFYHPFAEGGIFDGTDDIACSNGHVMKASHFNVSPYDTFAQTVKVEAENLVSQDTIINAVDPLTVREVTTNNPWYGSVSSAAYVEVAPETPTARVIVGYKIPNLLSAMKYDVYAVFVPATAGDTLAVQETQQKLRVTCRLRQADQNGVVSTPPFRNAKDVNTAIVDKVKLMSGVILTTSSYGLADTKAKFEIQSNTNGATLRIDRIIFVPTP